MNVARYLSEPSLWSRVRTVYRGLMSALGQKQTLERLRLMSALPPKADMDRHGSDVRFVPKADIKRLLNHLVGAGKDSRWNCESQSLRGLKIDDQLILRRRLNRKVARLLTLEDAINVAR